MDDLTTQITPQMLAMIPVVAAILQVLKKIPAIDKIKAYMPFIAMALSAGAIYTATKQFDALQSILVGLMASGMYDGAKAISTKNGQK